MIHNKHKQRNGTGCIPFHVFEYYTIMKISMLACYKWKLYSVECSF